MSEFMAGLIGFVIGGIFGFVCATMITARNDFR